MPTKPKLSFDVRRADLLTIREIAVRAIDSIQVLQQIGFSRLDVQIDLVACHANGCPLRLSALLTADDFNFAHDILGINRHINRDTGQLLDGFSPRYRVLPAPKLVA